MAFDLHSHLRTCVTKELAIGRYGMVRGKHCPRGKNEYRRWFLHKFQHSLGIEISLVNLQRLDSDVQTCVRSLSLSITKINNLEEGLAFMVSRFVGDTKTLTLTFGLEEIWAASQGVPLTSEVKES